MIASASPPPGTRATLAGADTWASIGYDVDGPSLEFVRPPFNLDLPLTDAELTGMADGVFPTQVRSAIGAATMPPSRPLTDADWAILAAIARAALQAPSPDALQTDAGLPDRQQDPPPVGGIAQPDGADPLPAAEALSAIASPPTTLARDEGDRDFKVILEFAERGDGPRQVIISVGGAGRSESFRRCDVDDWRDALLDEAPQVVEAFFARCRERPVYPAHRPHPATDAASGTKSGTGASKERPGRRGKGGAAATSPLLVFTPAPAAPDPGAVLPADAEAAPTSVPPPPVAGPVTPGTAADGVPQAPDDPAKPMRQQLSFLFG